MTEDESDFESARYGSTDFDYAAADPEAALNIFRQASTFVLGITAGSRTPRAAKRRMAVAIWIFEGKHRSKSVSALARELKMSRGRVLQIAEEIERGIYGNRN